MNGILNRKRTAGILLLCAITLALTALFGGAHTLTASDGATYEIAVTCGAWSGIPADASLEVSELSGPRYRDYYDRAVAKLGRVDTMRAFDVRCLAPDGTEIEPVAPVRMAFRLPRSGEAARRVRILHFIDKGGVVAPPLPASADEANGYYALDFRTESFSVYAVVVSAPLRTLTADDETASVLNSVVNRKYVAFTDDIFAAYALSGAENPYEAKIKEREIFCSTLAEAVAQARDGEEIELLSDVTGHFSLNTNRAISLNLSGHTLTVDEEEGVKAVAGTLTITNGAIVSEKENAISANGGAITLGEGLTARSPSPVVYVGNGGAAVIDGAEVSGNAKWYRAAAYVESGSSLEVLSGSITAEAGGLNNRAIDLMSGSTVTISGGEIVGVIYVNGGSALSVDGGAVGEVTADNGSNIAVSGGEVAKADIRSGSLSVSGGEIENVIIIVGSTATVSGGAISGELNADGGAVSVSGGEIGDVTAAWGGSVTISGGRVEGDALADTDGNITISGGRFEGAVSADTGGNIAISGGVFAQDVSAYVAPDLATPVDGEGYTHVGGRALTITADSGDKVYDGEALTVSTYGYAVEDLAEGDYIESVEITGSQTNAGESENVPSGAVIKNAEDEDVTERYAITYVSGTLTVTPKPIVVTAENASKVYSEADPAFTVTIAGEDAEETIVYTISLAEGEEADPTFTATIAGENTEDTIVYTLIREEGENVGTYAVTPSGEATQRNYSVTYAPGTLTITKAAVTVTADNQTKVYGNDDPELTATVEGLAEGATVDYAISREEGENVGTYAITVSGETEHDNYDVTYTPGTLTITKASVTITADDKTKVYGETDPELTATVEGLVREDTIPYTLTRETGDYSGTYAITPSVETEQENYDVTCTPGTLTITRAAVTVTADDKTKVYGDDDPELTATVEGLLGEDTIEYTLTRTEGDDAGTYTITPSGEAVQGNYDVSYETGELTITGLSVTVTADDKEKVYGGENPELTATVEGLAEGDSVDYELTREEGDDAGTYTITPSGEATQGNYVVTYAPGTFTITKATVTVKADSKEKLYDDDDPELTATVEGLVGEDTIDYEIFRESGEDVGEYAITLEGDEEQGNYNVVFTQGVGVFTILQRPVTVKITGQQDTADYDAAEHGVSGYDVEISDDLYTQDKFTFSGEASAALTDAGIAYMGLTSEQFANEDTQFDVTFVIEDGFQKINPIGANVTIMGHFDISDYDGTMHRVSGYDISIDNALYTPDDFHFLGGLAEASRTDAGTTYMNLSADQFENINANFEDVTFVIENGYQTITPIEATVRIVGDKDSVEYDGEEHSVGGYTASADTALYDVYNDIAFSGPEKATRMEAGLTELGLKEEHFRNTNENFASVSFEIMDGYIEITPVEDVVVTITGHNNTTEYDGEEHSVSGYDVQILEEGSLYKAEYVRFNGTDKAARTTAGTSYMMLASERFSNANPNFKNVSFEVTDGYQTITPIDATVTITGHTAEFAYDGEEHSVNGYEIECKTALYTKNDFTFSGRDEAVMTDAGIREMGLSADMFRNINPNFNSVTFEITDGRLVINPVVVVSKTLDNPLVTEPEDFTFRLTLRDYEDNPVANRPLADGIRTDENGEAEFTISVKGVDTDNTDSRRLDIPLYSSLSVTEVTENNVNHYGVSYTVNGEQYEGNEAFLLMVSNSETVIAFTNEMGAICRIEDEEFKTISGAIRYAESQREPVAVIEMLTDYAMPAADAARISANCTITLTTAPEYVGEGVGAAIITRAPGNVGVMFQNYGTLNLSQTAKGKGIVLDGNGETVEASAAMIENHGTLNAYANAILRNANSGGNGGAIYGVAGTVNALGAGFSGNKAVNGGAIYVADGAVNISSGSLTDNSADKGGAVYMVAGQITVSGGSVSGNSAESDGGAFYLVSGALKAEKSANIFGNQAVVHGGAIYSDRGGVTVAGGTIGGTGSDSANTAANGSAIFMNAGSATFTGGKITGNAATDENGGAVGIGSESARLNFQTSPYISGNTHTMNDTPGNVCLSVDSALIINALGLNNNNNVDVGIYVPGDGELYNNRGVSLARFGSYSSSSNVTRFKNDRTPGMQVRYENSWLSWGRSLNVEQRYLETFAPGALPPQAVGSNTKTTSGYYPAQVENYVSDIAAAIGSHVGGAVFACAFLPGDTDYSQCLSMVNWHSDTGDWSATRRDGTVVTDITNLILYYAPPAYLSIANNTNCALNITSLTLNGIASASSLGYGFVVARNGSTAEHFTPLTAEDMSLEAGQNIKLMFPGARNKTYQLNGDFSDTPTGSYSYDTCVNNERVPNTENFSGDSVSLTGNTFNDNQTIAIVFGEATMICKIVELNENGEIVEEHLFPSLQEAVTAGNSNYDSYKVHVTENNETAAYDTVKIEMLQDYLVPSGDQPNIPTGRNFTFTTAMPGKTLGTHFYTGDGERATLNQDQGNTNSFIKADTGGPGTSLTIEYLDFEGKQLSGDGNGGVVNTKNCNVTIRHANFQDFTASNGGAVFTKSDTNKADQYTLNISNANFTNCRSLSNSKEDNTNRWGGGAIWTSVAVFILSDCDFTSCGAVEQGGAVFHRIDNNYAYRYPSKSKISDCNFAFCTGSAGGGLELDSYDIEIQRCHFNDCHAQKTTVDGRNGGGFNAYLHDTNTNRTKDTKLTVVDCTFQQCSAVKNGGAFRSTYATTTVQGCSFLDSTAGANGGGIALTDRTDGSGNLILDNCTVKGNKSGAQGGGVYTQVPITLMNNTTITGNALTSTKSKVEDGAGVYINDKTLTVGPPDPTFVDTIIVKDNVTLNNQASNLNLRQKSDNETGFVNIEHCVIIRSNLSAESELRVLNANKMGTRFGQAQGIDFPSGMSAFQADNNDLRGGIDYTDDNGREIIWRGNPICKITDGNGALLYLDPRHTDPAVFDRLDIGETTAKKSTAFSLLRNDKNALKLYYFNGDLYDDDKRTYCVQMLVETYTVSKYITTNFNNRDWQTIVFTTASTKTSDTDKFFYPGAEGTYCTIIRSPDVGNNNLLSAKVNMKLRNITLDGNSANVSPSENTRILKAYTNNGYTTKATVTIGQNATLRNAHTTGNGAGVYLADGASLVIAGGTITGCIADGDGGGVYKDDKSGGSGQFLFESGSIKNCSANNGGGAYIARQNAGFQSGMSGGSIEKCSAQTSGGGVFVNSGMAFEMSGGTISGNSAGADGAGGGIAVEDETARLYFSGDAVVYGNTKGAENCNVELNQDSDLVINVTSAGLGENALIGVYAPGDKSDTESFYRKRGEKGKLFGTWSDNSDGAWSDNNYLFLFVNDRNDLRGAEKPGETDKIWWQEMQTLVITKTVVSALPSDHTNEEFEFVVKLEDESAKNLNGTFGAGRSKMTFENGEAKFTLKDGESKVAVYLPTVKIDGLYTVKEKKKADFDTTVEHMGDAGADEEAWTSTTGRFGEKDEHGDTILVHTAAFTNTRKPGDLTVTKVVNGESDDLNKNFTFQVLLSPYLSGTYGGMTFASNGIATFTLKDGESKTATGLPVGVLYTVREVSDSNFSVTAEVNGETRASASVENIELQPGANNNVTFTNTRKVGGLIVTKTVVSDAAADKVKEFNFTVTLTNSPYKGSYAKNFGEGGMEFKKGVATFKLKDGQSISAIGLPQGATYTVTEKEANSGFRTTYTARYASGTIQNDVITAAFTNTRLTGRLNISKQIVSDRYADYNEGFTFTVKLGKKSGNKCEPDTTINKTYGDVTFTEGVATVTVTPLISKTIVGLPQGMYYEVTEDAKDNFTNTAKSGATGTISATASSAVFTNTRKTGKLTVRKEVVSDLSADSAQTFNFTVRLGDARINKTYSGVIFHGEESASRDVTFTNGRGSVQLKGGEKITISGLPSDVTYTVTEDTNSSFTTEKSGNDTGTISADASSEVKFTNTRKLGSLEVSKSIQNPLSGDENTQFGFTITLSDPVTLDNAPINGPHGDLMFTNGVARFDLKSGQSKKAENLPVGVRYKVEETDAKDFTPKKAEYEGAILANGSKVAFTNSRQTVKLTVRKTVDSPLTKDKDAKYKFIVQLGKMQEGVFARDTTVTGRYDVQFTNGESAPIQLSNDGSRSLDLPKGMAYKVIETTSAGMSVSVKDANGDDMSVTYDANTAYVIGELDTDTLAHFTNKRDVGNLTISKTVSSDRAEDAEEPFTFTVRCQNITQNFTTEKTDKNGQTTTGDITTGLPFKLQDGESIRIMGLPVGFDYTVSETRKAGFNTEITNETGAKTNGLTAQGVIGAESSAAFTNTRITGNLLIRKVVDSDAATDKNDKTFTFTVTLTDKSIGDTTKNPDGAVYGGMTFKDGKAEFSLKHGESKLAEGLPTGVGYTVTETADDGFFPPVIQGTQTNGYSASGNIREGRSDVTFTNTRKKGALTVTKRVEGSATDKETPFKFRVTLGRYNDAEGFKPDESIGATTEYPEGVAYGEMTFYNGVAEFELTDGGHKRANLLPRGLEYRVEELLTDELSAKFTTTVTATGTINETEPVLRGTISDETESVVTFTNTRNAFGKVILRKVASDSDSNEYESLPGAKFTLYKGNSPTAYEVNGTPLQDLESGSNGIFWIGELPYGTYCMEETQLPDGIQANPAGHWWYTLTVDDTGAHCSDHMATRPEV